MFYITWNDKLAEGVFWHPITPCLHSCALRYSADRTSSGSAAWALSIPRGHPAIVFVDIHPCLVLLASVPELPLFYSSSLSDSTKYGSFSVNAFEHRLFCHVMRVRNFHWFMAALHFNCATATRQTHVILWPCVMALYTTFCDYFIKQLETSTLLNIRSNTVHWQKIGCWLVNEFENRLIM